MSTLLRDHIAATLVLTILAAGKVALTPVTKLPSPSALSPSQNQRSGSRQEVDILIDPPNRKH